MTQVRRRPEVLAPVGSPACLPAAVAGGADAVFLGLRHFNARGRAENFRKAELPHHVAYLHHHGVKCYLVMNTLVHDDEFPKALDLAVAAHEAGVDAAIIQDLGLWQLLTRELPTFKRHASTQMTIHDPSQVEVLADLGAERVILARELTLAEVADCTRVAQARGVETEHFVHGALCYAFSGQCLMSNFAGCRSANRGTCAQNCRFDYHRDEATYDSEISMKDLSLVARIGDLSDCGVASLKIEGRLKGPDYVYTTSRVYRAATEAWAAGRPMDVAWARELLKDVFARPQTEAPLDGVYDAVSRLHRYDPAQDRVSDATLVHIDRNRGEATIRSTATVAAGQGYSFSVGTFNGGFLVVKANRQGDRWRCQVRIADRGPHLPSGLPLFRNADHERGREARAAMDAVPVSAVPTPTIGIALTVIAELGQPLIIEAKTSDGRQATVRSSDHLVEATGKPLDEAMLRDKLGALGGSHFHLSALTLRCDYAVFVPASVLKELRRELVEVLQANPPHKDTPTWMPPEPGNPQRRTTALWVVVSDIPSGEAALAAGADSVWLDDPSIDWWSAQPPVIDLPNNKRWWLRHPATAPISAHMLATGHGIVAGHLGVIRAARKNNVPVIADLFCNTFSTETALALSQLGAQSVVISLECSSREVARLAARMATVAANGTTVPDLALIAHGRMPAMLTRQDHGLNVGASREITAAAHDGGLPYRLQRRAHGDTVIWEGRHLCAPDQVQQTAGLVSAWVLDLGDLNPATVNELTTAYAALRNGGPPSNVTETATRHAPHGLFPGHLEKGSRELDAVVDRMQESDTN